MAFREKRIISRRQTKITDIRHILTYAIMAVMALTSCTKNEFKIEFEFPKEFIGNYQATYYAWDSHHGAWMEETAIVQEGKAEINGVTRNPTIIYLKDISSGEAPIALYVERGDKLLIQGTGRDPYTWSVKGNKISEEWSEWRNANAETLRLGGDKATETRAAFVRSHPDSKLSALILLTEYDRRNHPEEFFKLWNGLSKKIRTSGLEEMCGTTDFPGMALKITSEGEVSPAASAKIESMTVRTRYHGLDTLRIGKAKGAILYFSESSSPARRQTLDTLRDLSASYPDSARRIVAEIYTEADSMQWIHSMRGDTLRNAVRGWAPKGLCDPDLAAAGVARLPWITVFGRGGKPVYSGDDITKAAKAFRQTMKQ